MERGREALADRLSGIFWILLGLAIIAYSSTMRIPSHLGATFLTGPGFVPILLGAALCVLGLVLIVRTLKGRVDAFLERAPSVSDRRALGALALMLVYALGLIGRIDFGVATVLFITAFITVFNLPAGGAVATARLLAGKAVLTATVTAVVVVFVFEELFYVRLP